MTESNHRSADHPIDPLFLNRWSPRAFTGESMPPEALATLFEAARWAPSSGNGQPWFFVYGHRGTEAFDRIYRTLDDGNRRWTNKASVLAVILSRTHRRAQTGELRAASKSVASASGGMDSPVKARGDQRLRNRGSIG